MTFEYFYDDDLRHWRWQLCMSGVRVAESSTGYSSRVDCLRAIRLVKGIGPIASVVCVAR